MHFLYNRPQAVKLIRTIFYLEFQLPFGVRLFDVYLKKNDLKEVLEHNLENSPYQSQSDTLSSRDCCCAEHRAPRSRTPRIQPCRSAPERTPVATIDEVFPRSEKDPFSSSGNSGPRLCKAMLEDLLLKGFKCCKCVDETDGELENGSSCDSSVASECIEKSAKPKNGFIYTTDDVLCNDIEQGREMRTHSRNSLHSRNSENSRNDSTLGPESGIEVTGSDFQSSAATHIDQRGISFGHVGSPEFSQNFQGNQEAGECEQCLENGQVKIRDDGGKVFGSETAGKIYRNDFNEIDDRNKESKKGVPNYCEMENESAKEINHASDIREKNILSKNVTSGDYDKIAKETSDKSTDQTRNEITDSIAESQCERRHITSDDINENFSALITKHVDGNLDDISFNGENSTELEGNYTDFVKVGLKEESQMFDSQLNRNVNLDCNNSSKHSEERREPSDCNESSGIVITDADDVPDDNVDTALNGSLSENNFEKLSEMPNKLHNRNLEVVHGVDKPHKLSSSEDSYGTADDVVYTSDSSEGSSEIDGVEDMDINFVQDGRQEAGDSLFHQIDGDIVHVCKPEKGFGSPESIDEDYNEGTKNEKQNKRRKKCCAVSEFLHSELAFLTADIFANFGVLPLLHLRAYTLQDATVYTCSYLYSGNFIISTVKSRYSHCFNCLKLFNEDRQYPKNGRFWP